MIEKLKPYNPIIGDDLPYNSMELRNIPNGFHFINLTPKSDCPLTIAKWDEMTQYAERYYSEYEIVAKTFVNFINRLQISYDENADTFERLLEVYESDIAKPILGRTEKITYDLSNVATGDNNSESNHIDIPRDNPTDENPTYKDGSISEINNTTKQTGTQTTELSDLGVRPNYESLNGFLDNNRTYYKVFVEYFKNNFTLSESLII